MKKRQARVRVRSARIGDESQIEDLYRQLHEADYISPGAAAMRRALRALSKRPDEILLVAVENRRIVGTNHVLIFRHLARALKPAAIIENMVVDRTRSRRGSWRPADGRSAQNRATPRMLQVVPDLEPQTAKGPSILRKIRHASHALRLHDVPRLIVQGIRITRVQSIDAAHRHPPQITSRQGTRQNHRAAAQRTHAALPSADAQSKAPAHAAPAA